MAIRSISGCILLFIGMASLSSCCNIRLRSKNFEGIARLPVPAGPEDIVLQNQAGKPRLIVSCDDRRTPRPARHGVLVAVNPITNEVTTLFDPPASESFHPHGISLGKRLHVLSHRSKTQSDIYVFRFGSSGKLILDEPRIPLPVGKGTISPGDPNDIAELPNGDLLLTTPKPFNKGRILRYSRDRKEWVVFDDDLPGIFPNGIWVHKNHVYVAFSMSMSIYRYDLSHPEPAAHPELVACGVEGADNFGAVAGDPGKLLLVSHRSLICFLLNSRTPKVCSSNSLWELDLEQGTTTQLVRTNNQRLPLNSGSVVIKEGPHYWLGQVYGNNLLRIKADTLKPHSSKTNSSLPQYSAIRSLR